MRATSLVWKGARIFFTRLSEYGIRQTWLWLYEKVARIRQGVSPVETSKVSEKLFVGGQQYKRGLETMRQLGIGATVSLRQEADDAARGVALPRHLWLPTPDDDAPTLAQLQQGVAFIREAMKAGVGVYIHCAQGVGRAPTLAAAYLIAEGHSPQSAMKMIRQARPFITPTPSQLKRLAEWERYINNGH
jgi:protein-tyrosine phosphatase